MPDDELFRLAERGQLRKEIEHVAIAWAVESSDNKYIDKFNILKASIHTMHRAVDKLNVRPPFLIIDGNYFIPYAGIPHKSIVKGDSLYFSIAAASVLAKTYRDEFMDGLHHHHPVYNWKQNKGYATKAHRMAILEKGITEYHRKSFNLGMDEELSLFS
jgi:ribonuclease HII